MRGALHAAPTAIAAPSGLRAVHYFKQRSLLRSRLVLPRVLFSFFLFAFVIHPDEGMAERRRSVSASSCRAVGDDPRFARRGAARPPGGRLSALHRGVVGRGPRLLPRDSPDPAQRAPRSQVVVPGGRGPGLLGAKRLRAAAAGRHSLLRLRLVSETAPRSEDIGSYHKPGM